MRLISNGLTAVTERYCNYSDHTDTNVMYHFSLVNQNVLFNLPMTSAMVAVELQVIKYV